MKKFLTLAASATLLLAACSEKPGYEITGTVANADLNGKYVYLYDYPFTADNAAPLDSALIQNGAFTLKGTAASPALRTLAAREGDDKSTTAVFVLDNAKLVATLGETASVSGTPENDAFQKLMRDMQALKDQQKALAADLKSEDAAISAAALAKDEAIDLQIAELGKAYIQANPTARTSAITLYNMRYQLNEDEQNQIIANADSAFKAVAGIDKLMAHLDILKTVAVGNKFIDFEMADAKGKAHKLSEYVGNGKNVVLIDFWASWCPPCRRDMPYLVEAYKKYKNKGFEIVGISLDSKAEAWDKGIKDLGITWPQLSDLQGWKNSGAALYGVNSIPHTVLVDKDGTIIAKNIHGKDLDAKIQEVLKK